MKDMVNVSICDGKYTIVQDASGRTNVLRYGESWRDATGDNVILGAAYEIEKLQARINRLEELGKELRECAGQLGWTSSEDSRWIERAEAAVKAWDKEAKP